MIEVSVKRRRGKFLEKEILNAAWLELSSYGYYGFTLDGVAKRSNTSKPVIYRRWKSKIDLATAAIHHFIVNNPIVSTELGNIRDEMIDLLRKYADRIPRCTTRLFFEMSQDMSEANDSFATDRFRESILDDMINRSVLRGEISKKHITPYFLTVPTKLVIVEIMVSGNGISDATITQIVDQAFLPIAKP